MVIQPIRAIMASMALLVTVACNSNTGPGKDAAGASAASSETSVADPTKGKKKKGRDSGGEDEVEHVIKLRFHLLKASGSKWLDTKIDDKKVREWVDGANEVWKSAKVRFEVEKVLAEDAIEPAEHDAAVDAFLKLKNKGKRKGDKTSKKDKKGWSKDLQEAKRAQNAARQNALPKTARIDRGLDVWVVGRLPAAGGVFGCPLRGIIFSERRGGSDDGLNIAKVLAHEIGHSLSLPHTTCADDQNLMMEGGCKHRNPENIRLNAEQIEAARKIAATGEPRPCRKGEESIDD